MILKYYGHACFSMTFSDGTVLVTDPFDESITYAPCDAKCDAALVSHHHHDHDHTETLKGDFRVIDAAGTFTVNGVKISAMPSWHDHHRGAHRGANLMFRIEGDGICIEHLGDLGHMPDARQTEFLKRPDVLLIPVGGHYTIDCREACDVIRLLQPRTAVAMHYRTPANPNFDAQDIAPFAKASGAAAMPRELELTQETLPSLPKTAYMAYE